jgi:hypothetical protein
MHKTPANLAGVLCWKALLFSVGGRYCESVRGRYCERLNLIGIWYLTRTKFLSLLPGIQ